MGQAGASQQWALQGQGWGLEGTLAGGSVVQRHSGAGQAGSGMEVGHANFRRLDPVGSSGWKRVCGGEGNGWRGKEEAT